MPRRVKIRRDPYAEFRRVKGLESSRDRLVSFMGPKCPYCGSGSTHPLKNVETDGFLQYRCGSCHKTFGKRV